MRRTTDILGLEIIFRATLVRGNKADWILARQFGNVTKQVVDFRSGSARTRAWSGRTGAAAKAIVVAITSVNATAIDPPAICRSRRFLVRPASQGRSLRWRVFCARVLRAAQYLFGAWSGSRSIVFVLHRLFELEFGKLRIDRRTVKKHVRPSGRGGYEAETLVGVERAYFSSVHVF